MQFVISQYRVSVYVIGLPVKGNRKEGTNETNRNEQMP